MVLHTKLQKKSLKHFGIKYKIIENNPDGININKDCGSTHIQRIAKVVKENKLSLGISYDGDGDRCLAVDENGELIDGDMLLAIFAKYLKQKGALKNDTVVATVMSNLGLRKFAEENEINVKQTKVGDRYVLEEMLKNGYNLGGEQSGHIILLDYNPTGDGILTSIMLCIILLKNKCKPSELKKIIRIYPQVLVNAKVNQSKKNNYNEDTEICNAIKLLEDEFDGSRKGTNKTFRNRKFN